MGFRKQTITGKHKVCQTMYCIQSGETDGSSLAGSLHEPLEGNLDEFFIKGVRDLCRSERVLPVLRRAQCLVPVVREDDAAPKTCGR